MRTSEINLCKKLKDFDVNGNDTKKIMSVTCYQIRLVRIFSFGCHLIWQNKINIM